MTFIRPLLILVSILLSSAALAGPVNINTADAQTLAEELTGVGLKKAQAIVAYREAHGPFDDLADLAAVKGIGVKLLERNRENVRLTTAE
ncbi:MAG: ComEA family DNA-binding protein [Gammaproteobacteria bacterium]